MTEKTKSTNIVLAEVVDSLLSKAAAADDSVQALQYSQAALNAAHTRIALQGPFIPK